MYLHTLIKSGSPGVAGRMMDKLLPIEKGRCTVIGARPAANRRGTSASAGPAPVDGGVRARKPDS